MLNLIAVSLSNQSIAQITPEVDSTTAVVVVGSSADVTKAQQDIEQWQASRGYITKKQKYKSHLYKLYSGNSLEKLMQKGDYWATRALAKREQGKAKIAVYERVITYDSTYAIQDILNFRGLLDIDASYRKISEQEKYSKHFELMSWCELSLLRGDRYAHFLLCNYELQKNKIEFTPAELQLVNENATALYKDFSARRAELGLGEFDNTEPQSVKLWVDKLLGIQ